MISSEVELLFTNIPSQETTDLCVQKLLEDKNCTDGLFKDSFCEMWTVTMTESFILLDNKYYRQHDEEAIGSPLGYTFANIFLCICKILSLEKCLPESDNFKKLSCRNPLPKEYTNIKQYDKVISETTVFLGKKRYNIFVLT